MPRQILEVKTKEAILKCFEKRTEHNWQVQTKTKIVNTVAEFFSVIYKYTYIFLIFWFPKRKFSKY
jgi:hypothetical protein